MRRLWGLLRRLCHWLQGLLNTFMMSLISSWSNSRVMNSTCYSTFSLLLRYLCSRSFNNFSQCLLIILGGIYSTMFFRKIRIVSLKINDIVVILGCIITKTLKNIFLNLNCMSCRLQIRMINIGTTFSYSRFANYVIWSRTLLLISTVSRNQALFTLIF